MTTNFTVNLMGDVRAADVLGLIEELVPTHGVSESGGLLLFGGTGLSVWDGAEDEVGDWELHVDSTSKPFDKDVVIFGYLPKGPTMLEDEAKLVDLVVALRWRLRGFGIFCVADGNEVYFAWDRDMTWFQSAAFAKIEDRLRAGDCNTEDWIVEASIVL